MTGLEATDEDGVITVRWRDRTVIRYRAVTDASKPHVDVLAPPRDAGPTGGTNLVLSRPHDHPWHLGLFFVQKLVDGINCWESERNAAAGRTYGSAHHHAYAVDADEIVRIHHECEWQADDDESLLADERTVTTHPPVDGGVLLTWDQHLTALGSARRLSSETLHGHYSGLAVRFRRSMRDGLVRLPDAENPDAGQSPRAATGPVGAWCDYSGPVDGSPAVGDPWTAGITLMTDHPDEFRWFTMHEPYGFIAANPTWERVLRLDAGESVRWRFGVWVHAGTPDRDAIEATYDRFRGET